MPTARSDTDFTFYHPLESDRYHCPRVLSQHLEQAFVDAVELRLIEGDGAGASKENDAWVLPVHHHLEFGGVHEEHISLRLPNLHIDPRLPTGAC